MPTPPDLVFPPYRLDLANEQLWADGQPVALRPKAFAVLRYLAEKHGQLVTKEEIFAHVWEGTAVASGLKVLIGELREALGDDSSAPRFVETVARRGYRFIAPVTRAMAAMPSAPPAARPVVPSLLVGRAHELARLEGVLAKALAGERQTTYVTGDAGTGKTTLLNAFLGRAAAGRELWIGEGRCIEHYGSGEAFLPILEALSRLCRGAGRDHLPALLRRYAPTWLVQLPWLLESHERDALLRELQGVAQERMLREMADALEALSADVPVILTLEDLHWSDYSTLDLLSVLTRRPGPARLLIVATYRPIDAILSDHPVKQLKQDLSLRGLCEELALESFTVPEVESYLQRRFPPAAPPAAVVDVVHRGTDGHPLFLAAIADDLAADGTVTHADDGWHWRPEAGATLGVPATIRQLIERQVERLDADERRTLEAASAIGATFPAAAVAAALDEDLGLCEERCEALAKRGQLLRALGLGDWPDGTPTGQYGFRHALHQRVLHDSIAAGRRSRLHAQLGERLEAAYGARAEEIAAELAVHFEEGRDHTRAVRYRMQAAANASRRTATREAVDHLVHAEGLLARLPEDAARIQTELALQMALGPALMSTRGYAAPEVERAFTRGRALCLALGDSAPLFPVLWGIFGFHVVRGEMAPARRLAEQCLTLAADTGEHDLLIEAHHALWVTCFFSGELATALDHVEQGLALYRPEHRSHVFSYGQDPGVTAHSYGALITWFMGRRADSDRHMEEALALGHAVGHPFSLGFALNFVAWVHYCRGDTAATRDYAQRLLTLATEQGFPFWIAGALHFAGWAKVEAGEVEAGRAELHAGLTGWRATGAGLGLPSHLGRTVEAHARAGDLGAAETTLGEALAATEHTGQRYYEAELHRLRGELLLTRARGSKIPADSEEALEQAVAIADAQRSQWLGLRAATSLARLRQRQGRTDDARTLLDGVIGGLDDTDTYPDASAARTLLVDLAKRKPARPRRP